jgi:putative transposase
MPWTETCAMDQRLQLIGDYLKSELTITDLSRAYGVSRNTVYKWIGRYETEGALGLQERSRAPRRHPNGMQGEIVEAITRAKLSHQKWGPKKLAAWLKARKPQEDWPAASTAGDILKRAGLVASRRRKHRTSPYAEPLSHCYQPNDVWSADFKGQFRTGDGKLCYPLTITDNGSRFPLLSRGLRHPSFAESQPWFEWTFREYGLPTAIRTDNGPPFGSVGLGGLSRLAVWFIRLGIRPERIEPGHPEQNGRHERFHRTLKEATAKPPKSKMEEQQKAFDEFILEFREERPNEALGQRTPASVYSPSKRPYPERLAEIVYETDEGEVRRVRQKGEIKFGGKLIYVSEALAGERLLLTPKANHLWDIRFSFYPLGVLDEPKGSIRH